MRLRTPSKYRAKRTEVDGVTFHSQREAARYQVLKLLLKAGEIRNLKLQPRYGLCPLVLDGADVRNINSGYVVLTRIPVANYVADFEYEEHDKGYGGVEWSLVVEDTKGMKTETYRLKKKWFESQYGIQIRET